MKDLYEALTKLYRKHASKDVSDNAIHEAVITTLARIDYNINILKEYEERKIIHVIECDVSDREISKCYVDDKAIGSCGQRADYCQWAMWRQGQRRK